MNHPTNITLQHIQINQHPFSHTNPYSKTDTRINTTTEQATFIATNIYHVVEQPKLHHHAKSPVSSPITHQDISNKRQKHISPDPIHMEQANNNTHLDILQQQSNHQSCN